MLNSVRARLTLWYAGALACALVAFSILVYALMARTVYARVDGHLRSALEVTALSLNHEIEEHEGKAQGEESFGTVLNTMQHTSFPRHAIAVYEGSRLIAEKPGADGLSIQRARYAASGAQPVFASAGPIRTAVVRVDVPFAKTRYTVIASESLEPAWAELREFRNILFAVVPLILALAALPGYFLARRSLAPVLAMSEAAANMGSKNLDERLRVVNPGDELGRLAAAFNSLLGRLDSAFRQQRQFMADASHELRTPVSVARTAAEVTLERQHRAEGEYRDALKTIDQQMRRLTRIVQDMFVLARADAGVYPVERSEFYLDELLRQTMRAAMLLGTRKGVEIAAAEFPESPLYADESLIRQLVMILLDNAIKYTPEGGRVHLDLTSREDEYEIAVTDTGPGIPVEARAQIFERFYRVDKARSRASAYDGSGAGLGLAIAQWIAELHCGSLRLDRSGAEGSRFSAVLPGRRVRTLTVAAG